jgi:hypothetical protein
VSAEPGAGHVLIRKTIEEKIGIVPESSGIVLDFESGKLSMRRKPSRVFIERKVGFKYQENLFLCLSPLKTMDHIEMLKKLEAAAISKSKR